MPATNLRSSLGVDFISIFTCGVLWGITCSQVFHYYSTRPKDSVGIKMMVALMWAFDSTHQMLLLVGLYKYCVTHFGDYDYLKILPRTAPVEVATIQFTATIAQGFYMFKIWKLSQSFGRKFIISIAMLYLTEFGVAVAVVYSDAISGNLWANLFRNERILSPVYGVVIFVTDACIAGMMCYLLRRHRTEYAETKSIVSKLVVFVISTNLLTACVALSFCIIAVLSPKTEYAIPPLHITVRLYANSFMSALNMRPYLRYDVPHPAEHSMWQVRAREGSLVDSSIVSSRLSQERNKSIPSHTRVDDIPSV